MINNSVLSRSNYNFDRSENIFLNNVSGLTTFYVYIWTVRFYSESKMIAFVLAEKFRLKLVWYRKKFDSFRFSKKFHYHIYNNYLCLIIYNCAFWNVNHIIYAVLIIYKLKNAYFIKSRLVFKTNFQYSHFMEETHSSHIQFHIRHINCITHETSAIGNIIHVLHVDKINWLHNRRAIDGIPTVRSPHFHIFIHCPRSSSFVFESR